MAELSCEWTDCNQIFNDLSLYLQHIHENHINEHNQELDDESDYSYSCQWIGCEENRFDNYSQFRLHVSYHGFHQKLMSNGLAIMKTLGLHSLCLSREDQIHIVTISGDTINCYMDSSGRNVLPELPNIFVCGWEKCFADFTDSESFYRHVERHAFEDIAIPSISKEELKKTKFAKCLWIGCSSACTSRSHLREHLRTHTQEKLMACPSCGAMFCNRSKFVDHLYRQMETNNKTDSLTIQVSKGDDTSMTSVRHIVSIQMPRSEESAALAVDSSGTSSVIIQNLNSDNELMLIDLGTPSVQRPGLVRKSFECSNCGQQFPTQSLLSEHSRSHDLKYKCCECQKMTSSPSALRHHMAYRHSTERPFACQFCDLKFKSRSDLRRHIDTHSSEPPFQCSSCSFQSRSVHTFSKHLKEQHLAIKCQYICHKCDKKFSRGNNLTRHLITIHKCVLPEGCSRFQYDKQEDGTYRLSDRTVADSD